MENYLNEVISTLHVQGSLLIDSGKEIVLSALPQFSSASFRGETAFRQINVRNRKYYGKTIQICQVQSVA